jgi:hypothetical protein
MSQKVIDTRVLKQTGSVSAALRDASIFNKKDIGKTFVPINVARLSIQAPMIPMRNFLAMKQFHANKPLPANFNWGDKPNINSPQDQGSCGSCWAVSSASAIGDQWSIAVKAKKPIMLAALAFGNCIPGNDCDVGGWPSNAGEYASKSGIVADADWPYSCDDCEMAEKGKLPQKCISGQGRRFFTKAGSVASAVVLQPNVQGNATKIEDVNIPATLELIKTTIMNYGPMVTGFAVPSGFMDIPADSNYIFKSDPLNNFDSGGHAVVITGWGTTSDNKLYWIIRNSWTANWGDKGYCRVYAYPLNDCGFDVPIFVKPRLRQLNDSIQAQLPPNLRFSFQASLEPAGGVTIWQIDTVRSPKVEVTFGAGLDKKNWFMWLALAVGAVVIIALIWALWKSHKKPQGYQTRRDLNFDE